MTRNVRIKKEYVCTAEGCKFTSGNRMTLQKHYEGHNLKEQLQGSLTITGWNYEIE